MTTGIVNNSGVTYIMIEGEKIKLRFGLPACQAFYEMILSEDSEKYINKTALTPLGIAKLLHAGYVNNCLAEDAEIILQPGKFLVFVEDMILEAPQELENAVKVFEESKYTRKATEQAGEVLKRAEEEAKKKLIGHTSNLLHSLNSDSANNSTTPALTESSSSRKRGTNVTKPKSKRKK